MPEKQENPGPGHVYNLGPVKSWVKDAVQFLGNFFDITTVYGYSKSGSVPGSLHPKGRAADFMTSAMTAEGKKKGDALASFVIANAKALGATEVIWNRRIATAAHGWQWRDYHGPRSHTDHVHVSFADHPGTGIVDTSGLTSWLSNGVGAVGGAVGNVAGAIAPGDDPTCGWKLGIPVVGSVCVASKVQIRQTAAVLVGGTGAALFVIGLIVLVAYGLKQTGAMSAIASSALPVGRVANIGRNTALGKGSGVPTMTNPEGN